jgi:hypothetical protein
MDTNTVFKADGNVDFEASIGNYKKSLAAWADKNLREVQTIRSNLTTLFEMFENKRQNRMQVVGLLTSMVAEPGMKPKEYMALQSRVETWVDENCGSTLGHTMFLDSQKGKGGGICLNTSDVQKARAEREERSS